MLINTHAIVTAFFPNVICAPSRDHFFFHTFFLSFCFFLYLFLGGSCFYFYFVLLQWVIHTIIAADAMDKTRGNRMVFLSISSEVATAEFQLLPTTRI